ncbi:hypothetical protein ACNOYE_33480 [Nannocystaceae bacterium ST9]
MADQPDLERSGSPDLLAPPTGAREDSGLQDILSVTTKLKERDDLDPVEGEPKGAGDSGMIVFGSKDLSATESDDSGLFMSFSGGLGAGGIAAAPMIADPDLATLGGEGSVRETKPMEPSVRPAEEPKRNPLVAVAVVLGLCMLGGLAVVLTQKDDPKPVAQAQNEAEMTAKPEDPATVAGVGAEAEPQPTTAIPGPPVEPEPDLVMDGTGETAGPVGETEGPLADSSTMGEGDPLAQTDDLLAAQGSGAAKKPTYGGGVKQPAGTNTTGGAVVEEPEPEPEPEPDPLPLPEPKKNGGGSNSAASQDEVDCLLNPDLPKCGSGGGGGGKSGPVLVPKVPEKLDSAALKSGFGSIKTKAKACGSKFGAAAGSKVKIHASIEGATGKVTSVDATGEHAGTDLGKCVEDAVKDATFDKFKSPAQGVDYSIVM